MGLMSTEDPNGLMSTDDMFALPPSYTRRSSGDGESSARVHPLYKNIQPSADGLFHCPWEGQQECNHKPEKLKWTPFLVTRSLNLPLARTAGAARRELEAMGAQPAQPVINGDAAQAASPDSAPAPVQDSEAEKPEVTKADGEGELLDEDAPGEVDDEYVP